MFRLVVVSYLLALSLGASIPKSRKPLRNFRPIFPSGRIVGGQPTPIEDIPYQVALEYSAFQFCGGSIIASDTILSSGRCVETFSANDVQIRTGSSKHEIGGKLLQAKSLIIHPDYDSNAIDYDVSIIKLEKPIELGPGSQPITLADEEPTSGGVLVSGWGILESGGEAPNTLYSVLVPIVDRATCEEAYNSLNLITDRMICAGAAEKGSCQGDSGGPVVLRSGDEQVQVGIVSWSLGCALNGYPGVHTNVANNDIRSFIRDVGGV